MGGGVFGTTFATTRLAMGHFRHRGARFDWWDGRFVGCAHAMMILRLESPLENDSRRELCDWWELLAFGRRTRGFAETAAFGVSCGFLELRGTCMKEVHLRRNKSPSISKFRRRYPALTALSLFTKLNLFSIED